MLRYLSVHDIVWINSTLTGQTVPFDYEKLEAAMAAQYSYGASTDVEGQAANLLASFILKPPFAYGNVRTAFVAVTTFLYANGYALHVGEDEAVSAIRDLVRGSATAAAAVARLATPAPEHTAGRAIALRTLVTHICNDHAQALAQLKEGDE